ncbi:hypothetical protein OEIGOIKO_00517 [Streptomyces chrestomyceticus JCM 4735]|uniref:Uncharacterized protein n=1 Tax=Streptomyces chrestomyceticus JCM 4735 TaxID=1306181 RepID=A0A7U9PY32_9ACTN|nr:hypothetical protein [Streptomyces chrestomyceticus]GCD32799.1 hypothetical protein OEIGOIKO_00517 [Streptomyces chrestomyceticus JCM 4735]
MAPPAADGPRHPDVTGDPSDRGRAPTAPPGSISVGGSVSGGVLSTGPEARITYGAAEPDDPARLLAALGALRTALLAAPDPDPGVGTGPGSAEREADATGLDAELAAAQEEIERHGTLTPPRRRALRERLDIIAAAAAGGASLAALAQSVASLLT